LETDDSLSKSISSTSISLVSQTTKSTLQQPISLMTSNNELEYITDESDEQLDDKFDEQLMIYKGNLYCS
ncbi:1470_t:CDS:1, partial [Racocetra fulgida]